MSPWTVACQAPLTMELSRQEYWSGLPFPSPETHQSQGPNPVTWPSLKCILLSWDQGNHVNHNALERSKESETSSSCHRCLSRGKVNTGNGKYTIPTAATAAKSLQLCPTLCDPIDGSPPGFPIPGTLQARTLEWVAISFSNA